MAYPERVHTGCHIGDGIVISLFHCRERHFSVERSQRFDGKRHAVDWKLSELSLLKHLAVGRAWPRLREVAPARTLLPEARPFEL